MEKWKDKFEIRNSEYKIEEKIKNKKGKNKVVHEVVNNVDKLIHKAVEVGGKVLLFLFFRGIMKGLWKSEI